MVYKRYDKKDQKQVDYDHLRENYAIFFIGFYKNDFGYIKKINKEF